MNSNVVSQLPLLLAVFSASLVGSVHCAGMCGSIVAFYSTTAGEQRGCAAGRRTTAGSAHAAYHGARLFAYATLGALAGSLGMALDFAGDLAGIGRSAAIVAGTLIVLWGVSRLLEVVTPELSLLPGVVKRLLSAAVARAATFHPTQRAGLLGLISAFLPCGFLYAFALTAATTGSALSGALVMAAFWLGTVPVLLGLGVGTQTLTPRLQRHIPLLSAASILFIGLYTLWGRSQLDALSLTVAGDGLKHSELPCCTHPGRESP